MQSGAMNRRTFLSLACAAPYAVAQRGQRPNIVLILADDMGFSDLGCYGGEIKTPHIDSLASQGLRFRQFYNAARCCPTRASLLTGLYPHQAGVGHMVDTGRPDLPSYQGDLNENCVTIAQVLRAAGYRTMMSGKWHVTPVSPSKHNWPLQRCFERHYGTIHGAGSFYDPVTLTLNNEPAQPEGRDYYYTDAITNYAERFLDELGRGPAPFFLYLAYTSPHWPMHAFESDIAKYKGRYKDGWDALRAQRHKRMTEMGVVDAKWPLTPRDAAAPAWGDEPHKEWMERRMEVYAAMVDRMDQNLGRLLAKLRAMGQEENTLILFLSDNGGCAEELRGVSNALHVPKQTRDGRPVRFGNLPEVMPGKDDDYQSYGLPWANASNTPFRLYKHWVHEGGIATPLIARWPKGITKRGGGFEDEPSHLIDIMATCADLGGAAYPSEHGGRKILPMEGRSLAPLFAGRRPATRRELYWEHEGNRAVRQGKWKLVSRHPGQWELFDLAADRTELKDLAAAQPAKTKELAAHWDAWAARAGVLPWTTVRPPR
jgi:arylsulfatase A-like enzyme